MANLSGCLEARRDSPLPLSGYLFQVNGEAVKGEKAVACCAVSGTERFYCIRFLI